MDIQSEILKTIEIMVDKKIESLNLSSEIPTVIQGVNGSLYKVKISGTEYWLKDGVGLSGLQGGVPVWVRVPNNKMAQAYICAKR